MHNEAFRLREERELARLIVALFGSAAASAKSVKAWQSSSEAGAAALPQGLQRGAFAALPHRLLKPLAGQRFFSQILVRQ